MLDNYGHGDRQVLIDYLTEHYSARDCGTLGRTGAATGPAELASEMERDEWLRDFLLWAGPGAGAGGPGERWRRALPAAIATARELIEAVQEQHEPVSLAGTLAAADGASRRNALALGLGLVSREALLLFGLDADARLFVGSWQVPGGAEVRGPAPEFVDTLPLFCRPLLIDDMATLLVESTVAPPRIKADRVNLFARAREAIGAALMALPVWIKSDEGPLAIDVRVDVAAISARRLGLAAVTGSKRQGPQPGSDQTRPPLADARRPGTTQAGARHVLRDGADESWYSGAESPYASGRESNGADLHVGLDYLPYDPGLEYPWVHRVDCRTAVTDAFRSVADAEVVSLSDFVVRQCLDRNPLTALAYLPYLHQEDIAQQWQTALFTFFNRRLIALGGVTLGPLTDGQLGFRLTPVGRYLLGETDQLKLDAPTETPVRSWCNPTSRSCFWRPRWKPSSAPVRLRSPLPRCKARTRSARCSVLRRESIQRAVMAGQDTERIIASLRELSKHPLPDNVDAAGKRHGPRRCVGSRCARRWWWIAATPRRPPACWPQPARWAGNSPTTTVELLSGNELTAAMRKKLQAGGIFIRH